MSAVLEVRHLSKAYGGVQALVDVSFSIASGELLALIGPNGAGKTTCFNVLNGQIAPDSGEVEVAGEQVSGRAPYEIARLGVGRTFQLTATFSSMTLRENVQVALLAHRRKLRALLSSGARFGIQESEALLAQVGLRGQAARPCAELAYGDLKRLELAIALANHPRLLLMDEPTAGLGPGEREALMDLAARFARDAGIAVLFTEHDMSVVFGYATRVVVLHQGRIIAAGEPAAVRADPRVREVYLGDA